MQVPEPAHDLPEEHARIVVRDAAVPLDEVEERARGADERGEEVVCGRGGVREEREDELV
jgi:hypothetical protein